jgi:hypothetical protein
VRDVDGTDLPRERCPGTPRLPSLLPCRL